MGDAEQRNSGPLASLSGRCTCYGPSLLYGTLGARLQSAYGVCAPAGAQQGLRTAEELGTHGWGGAGLSLQPQRCLPT